MRVDAKDPCVGMRALGNDNLVKALVPRTYHFTPRCDQLLEEL